MPCFVFSEPVTALVLTVKPLQPWPSVDEGSKMVISATLLCTLTISLAAYCLEAVSDVFFFFSSFHKEKQPGEKQPSQSGGGLSFWQELQSPLVHRLQATFKVTHTFICGCSG